MTTTILHIYRYGNTDLHATVLDKAKLPPQDIKGVWRHVWDSEYQEGEAPRAAFDGREAMSNIASQDYHLFEFNPMIRVDGKVTPASGQTIDQLKSMLTGLQPGKAAHVPYEIFEDLFPPGVEDDGAKERAYKFAKEHGCVIVHRSRDREVLFVKPAA